MMGLNETGEVTDDVVAAMRQKRCGMKDFLNEEEQQQLNRFQSELRRRRKRQAPGKVFFVLPPVGASFKQL